jgi:hypothetical protein
MLPYHFFPLFKKAGCSNVLLKPNNTLKYEIQIENLKNLQKMLSSQNIFNVTKCILVSDYMVEMHVK